MQRHQTIGDRGTDAGVFVALLRGINVGRAKRVAMADLRALFEQLGYRNVRTLLNSGNVVFEAAQTNATEIAARIEAALVAQLGVAARTTVLTARELAQIVHENPLRDIADAPARLLLTILRNARDRALLEPLLAQDWSPEVLRAGTRVVYLWCPGGFLASRAAQAVAELLGDGATTRNWATLGKLHELAGG